MAQAAPLHLTSQLADTLREHIRGGMYESGRLIPSERDLAEHHGLSRTTVRRAIQLLVDERLLFRVPGSGTYVGQPTVTTTVQATLGLVVPTLANPGYAEFSRAIEKQASARGFNLLVGQSDYVADTEAAYLLRYADNASVQGVVAVPCGDPAAAAAYRQLQARGVPFVFLVRGVQGIEADEIETDHVGGAQAVVRHLIELGHRDIAYVGTARGLPHRHLQGYRQALAEAEIAERPELVVMVDTDDETAGIVGARRLLEQDTAFTAVFARIDQTAAGVLRVLREHGLRVPDDVSVAGFDNTKLDAYAGPPLTTVEPMRNEIGRLGILFLLDRIEGRYNETPRRVVVQPRLVLRESCAAPAR